MATTRKLIIERDPEVTLLKIYTDLGIPPGWIQKFARGQVSDPSVNRVQALWEYLSGKKLAV